jgi:deoxyadenosine/deoxycytidine kinase
VEIFAKNLYEMGLMSERDYDNYKSLFHEMTAFLRPPDLLIYLRAQVPTLVRQIQARGRDYESSIRIDYLERLNQHYETWVASYPHQKLVIDTDDLDFVSRPEDLGRIISMVEQRLFGLFS